MYAQEQQPKKPMAAKNLKLKISGMRCASCEVLIERKLRKVPGVAGASVSYARQEAEVSGEGNVNLTELQAAVQQDGYTLSPKEQESAEQAQGESFNAPETSRKRRYAEIGAAVMIVFGLYLLLKQLKFLPGIGISENMGYGIIFLIGLVAATSTCLAVAGGLLLAVAAKHREANPNLSGWQRFMPHTYFNVGRIAGYTLFGGLVGILGSVLAPSPWLTGTIIIASSVLMILVGIQMLHLFPWLNRFSLKMPKFITHRLYDASISPKKSAVYASLFGASTFFLPCGFTQALQLYALSKGSFAVGALTMLAFSLGTLPSLLGIGAFSSFAKGSLQRHFMTFSAVLVIVLGIFNIPNGLALTGASVAFPSFGSTGIDTFAAPDAGKTLDTGQAPDTSKLENAKLVDGKQVIELAVRGLDYFPTRFTVLQGIPVEWRIDGRAAEGCAQVISVPKLGITEYLPKDRIRSVTFTPNEAGRIEFSCTMWMAGPGVINVLPNANGRAATAAASADTTSPQETACDPAITDCFGTQPSGTQQPQAGESQRFQMEISRGRGFYPNTFTVKQGIPVELEIDAKVKLGGCMGTLIVPEYSVAHTIPLGKSVLRFTPTKAGVVPFTCSMGAKMGQFVVV